MILFNFRALIAYSASSIILYCIKHISHLPSTQAKLSFEQNGAVSIVQHFFLSYHNSIFINFEKRKSFYETLYVFCVSRINPPQSLDRFRKF